MLFRHDMHEYQEKAVQYIKDKERCMLLLFLGAGKTVITLTAVSDILDGCLADRVLVVAPLRVANSVWAQEAGLWHHLKGLTFSVVTGSQKERLSALFRKADVCVINRENLPWLVEHYGKKWPFDFVVIDESSSMKNPSTKRFRALRKVLPFTNYMVLLTGTPTPNGLLDLWSQMYAVDYGQRLGRTVSMYRQRFFNKDYWGHTFTLKEGKDKEIHALVADKCLSLSGEDYLQLPDRIDIVEKIELPPAVKAAYDKFEKDLFSTLPDGEELEAVSAAVLANKLLQWCSGAAYTDDKGNWSEIHRAKIDALLEMIDVNDEPVLVAYNFKSDLVRLKGAIPDAVVLDKNPDTIARWNRGEIKVLLAHPASAGHGLNLQRGGALCVWFSLTWSLEHYQQFNARLHRQGQGRPVRVVHLVAGGCIDERVLDVLKDKNSTQNKLLLALKP